MGDEMKSDVIPKPKLDLMEEKSNKDAPDQRKTTITELYHEGYVDGKRYLVPDSNLEAMKDIINLKMRPRKSTRYKHQTSYGGGEYEEFNEKIHKLLTRIGFIENSDDDSDSNKTDSKEQEKEKERKDFLRPRTGSLTPHFSIAKENNLSPEEHDMESKEEKDKVNKSLSEHSSFEEQKNLTLMKSLDDSKRKQADEEVERSSFEEPKKLPLNQSLDKSRKKQTDEEVKSENNFNVSKLIKQLDKEKRKEPESTCAGCEETLTKWPENDEYHLRFLISGHFNDDETPMYIIQEYDEKLDIFKDQKLNFISSQTEGNANIFVTGKLFDENILEKSHGKLKFLKTKANKIPITASRSNIFYENFENVFSMKGVDVSVKGEFVKNEITKKIIPLLSIGLKQKESPNEADHNDEIKRYVGRKDPTPVIFNKSKCNNPFSKKSETKKNFHKTQTNYENSSKKNFSNSPYLPQGANIDKTPQDGHSIERPTLKKPIQTGDKEQPTQESEEGNNSFNNCQTTFGSTKYNKKLIVDSTEKEDACSSQESCIYIRKPKPKLSKGIFNMFTENFSYRAIFNNKTNFHSK